jgi:hypothetical protein
LLRVLILGHRLILEMNFIQLPFTPPSGHLLGPSIGIRAS